MYLFILDLIYAPVNIPKCLSSGQKITWIHREGIVLIWVIFHME